MIEKPKRPKKIPNQDNKQPQTIQELIRRYDLDNTKIYDFLDELVMQINYRIKETVLYENEAGTTEDITLTESAEKFSYIEIFYTDNQKNKHSSVKVYSPNGKHIDLNIVGGWYSGTNTVTDIRNKEVVISETTIKNAYDTNNRKICSYLYIAGMSVSGHEHADYIYITKVVGYRENGRRKIW